MSDYNPYTHCSHGKTYKEDCEPCEKIWALHVSIPNARAIVARLMRFYDAKSIVELLFCQDKQIEKLQAAMQPMREFNQRVREG